MSMLKFKLKKPHKFLVVRGKVSHGGVVRRAGDIIVCSVDLATMHNLSGVERFKDLGIADDEDVKNEKIVQDSENKEGLTQKQELQIMTIEELKTIAENNEIDLKGITLKSDIIEAILEEIGDDDE